jgi:pimeloyl-ACP methyl ester carboxylesterase
VLDLLGCGRSDRPDGRAMTIHGHAERLLALLDALRIDRACMVGHGLGGAIAADAALTAPARVSRLCLINAICFDGWLTRPLRVMRALAPLLAHLPPAWVIAALHTSLAPGYLYRRSGAHSLALYARPYGSAEGRAAVLSQLAALDEGETGALGARLRAITAPTAIICGRDDPLVDREIGEQMHRAVPGSTLHVLDDTRHFAPEEAPEAVTEVLTGLLAR